MNRVVGIAGVRLVAKGVVEAMLVVYLDIFLNSVADVDYAGPSVRLIIEALDNSAM